MFSTFYDTVFYKPLLNSLIFLVDRIPFQDLGVAIIILTLGVRFIIFPFTHKSTTTQIKIRHIEPELKDIKEKHKGDQQTQAQKTMELYRKHGINPLSGFLTLLVQLPIVFALYKVFISWADFDAAKLYSFVSAPESINTIFLGLVDMTQRSYFLAFLAAITQFFQMKLALPPTPKAKQGDTFKDNMARSMNLQMKYIMPVFIFFIAVKFSSALALYWTTMNVFAIVHEAIVRNKAVKIYGKTNTNNNSVTERNS